MDHPRIVKLNKIFQDSENVYFLLEYCKGGTLFDFITDRGNLINDNLISQ